MAQIDKKILDSLHEKLVNVNRVTKVVKGGRKFSFTALVVVGNKNVGMVGYGYGKADELTEAISKAKNAAIKSMFLVPLYEGRTIHHDVKGKKKSSQVSLRRAKAGTGVIAGATVRIICECLGIEDLVAKSLGSSNPKSLVDATFDALNKLNTPESVEARLALDV